MNIKRMTLIMIGIVIFGILWSFMFYTQAFAEENISEIRRVCLYYENENGVPTYPINWGFFGIGIMDSETQEIRPDSIVEFYVLGNNCVNLEITYSPEVMAMYKEGCGSEFYSVVEFPEDTPDEYMYFSWPCRDHLSYIPIINVSRSFAY